VQGDDKRGEQVDQYVAVLADNLHRVQVSWSCRLGMVVVVVSVPRYAIPRGVREVGSGMKITIEQTINSKGTGYDRVIVLDDPLLDGLVKALTKFLESKTPSKGLFK
jgi:hypothetical protein